MLEVQKLHLILCIIFSYHCLCIRSTGYWRNSKRRGKLWFGENMIDFVLLSWFIIKAGCLQHCNDPGVDSKDSEEPNLQILDTIERGPSSHSVSWQQQGPGPNWLRWLKGNWPKVARSITYWPFFENIFCSRNFWFPTFGILMFLMKSHFFKELLRILEKNLWNGPQKWVFGEFFFEIMPESKNDQG